MAIKSHKKLIRILILLKIAISIKGFPYVGMQSFCEKFIKHGKTVQNDYFL